MFRLVALDTTSEFGSLALIEDDRIMEEVLLHAPDGFADVLFPQLQRLLSRHGWSLRKLDGFAAGAGPGSFTGVRVALSAVKGLAEAAGTRAAAISNLQAMATFSRADWRAPFYDARRGEIYAALYNADLETEGETVLTFQAWQAKLPAGAELLTPYPELFPLPATQTPKALAGAIGLLAQDRLTDPAALDANYVRRPDAELNYGVRVLDPRIRA